MPASETAHTFVDLLPEGEHTIIMDAYYDHGIGPASTITVITEEADPNLGKSNIHKNPYYKKALLTLTIQLQ